MTWERMTYITHNASPSKRGDGHPKIQIVFAEIIVHIKEGDARLYHDVGKFLVDF